MLPTGKRILLFLPLLFLTMSRAFPQEIAAYSRFGFGELTRQSFTAAAGAGGLGAAYRSPFHINSINPASYTSLRLTTIEGGFYFAHKSLIDGLSDRKYKTGDGFFDHFALGFPSIKKKLGFSCGITPYSKMKYSFTQNRTDPVVGDYVKIYDGNGRLYRLYVGGAYNFFKTDTFTVINQFSIGVNAAYIFGTLRQFEVLDYGSSTFYNTRVSSVLDMNNFALNTGLQYVRRLKQGETNTREMRDNPDFVAGAYASFPVVSATSLVETWDRYVVLPAGIRVIDSVSYVPGNSGNIKIPVEFGAGLSFSNKNLFIGAEGNYSIWDNTNVPAPDVQIDNSWTVRGGLELTPTPKDELPHEVKLLEKITYRLGGYYSNGNLTLNQTRISEFAASFGLSIPVTDSDNRQVLRFSLSLEAGSRGTTNSGYLRENFVRISFGFTFSQIWFKKLRYD